MLHGWWASMATRPVFDDDDVDVFKVIAEAGCHVHLLFSPPYNFVAQRLVEPPDGFIITSFWLIVGLSACLLAFLERLLRLYLVHFGYLSVPSRSSWLTRETTRPQRSPRRRRQAFVTKFCTILSSQINQKDEMDFLSDGDTIMVDNSANAHICRDKKFFVGEIRSVNSEAGVATIGGTDFKPAGIGTVEWTWTDDNGRRHTMRIENVLYFPQSPVNVLSVTAFASQLGDEEGTWIKTKMKYSQFTWDSERHSRRIEHSENCLPELPINNGYGTFVTFCNSIYELIGGKRIFAFTSAMCPIDKSQSTKPVDFDHEHSLVNAKEVPTPEDEKTRENSLTSKQPSGAALKNLTSEQPSEAAPSMHPGHKQWSDQPAGPAACKRFTPGQKVRYTREGHTDLATVVAVSKDADLPPKITLHLNNGDEIVTSSEFLFYPDEPDIASIPVTGEEYRRDSSQLSKEDAEKIANPESLSKLQQLFLSWHERLQHLPNKWMFRLSAVGVLPKSFLKLKDEDNVPICASCCFGQAHRRPWRARGKGAKSIRRDDDDKPGKGTSTDQMVSAQPGLVPQMSGSLTRARIWAVNVFVDHMSDLVYVHLMRSTTQEETLAAKTAYERYGATHGVTIKRYHADNGRYAEQPFRDACAQANQELTFCGVGAHHQNGIAENHVKQLTLGARTLLLHAKRHWPEAITTMLWPYAIKAAAERHNNLKLDDTGRSPIEKFSATKSELHICNFHTFGCPVYVLDSRLQDRSGGVPKWEPRSRVGIYLGHSPVHAGSVALVLNPKSGLVSPQYHVVFDDEFSTVPHMRAGSIPPNWEDLVQNSSELGSPGQFSSAPSFEPIDDPSEHLAVEDSTRPVQEQPETQPLPSQEKKKKVRFQEPISSAESKDVASPQLPVTSQTNATPVPVREGEVQANEGVESEHLKMPDMIDLATTGLRRSARTRKPTEAAKASYDITARKIAGLYSMICLVSTFTQSIALNPPSSATMFVKSVHYISNASTLFDETINVLHPMVFAANQEQNEVFTFRDMMKQDDNESFIMAMVKEINDHEERGHWTLMRKDEVDRSKLNPRTGKVDTILSIWSFKRKRFPDGRLMKHKARLCAHGGQQQWGVNYWETYAPVVNWISVRALLAIASIHKLPSRSIDFVLAFPQADLDVDVFMELPIGMDVDGNRSDWVLKLNKSLYGLKQASSNWFQKLKEGLEDRDYVQSQVDPCVFLRDDSVVLTYVDDCIIVGKEQKVIDELIHSLMNGKE